MEQPTIGPPTATVLNCKKMGHQANKCWSKNPGLKKAYMENRYGKKLKKEKEKEKRTPGSESLKSPASFCLKVSQ